MNRDLQRSLRSLDVMRSHSATIARLVDQVNSSGVVEAIRQMERQQAAILKALSFTDYAARNAEIFKSATRLHELSLQPLTNIQTTLDQVHRSWLSEFSSIKSFVRPAEMAKISLSDISRQLATAKLLWTGIDYDVLARALNVQQSIMVNLQNSMSAFTISYRNLTESFGSVADVVKLPSIVLSGATREVSTTGYALEVLHPFDDELDTENEELEVWASFESAAESSALMFLLERTGSEFVATYRGAVEALNGDNPDRSRHVLSSLRTLLDHVLRKFAPRDKVGAWIVERGYHSYLDNGKPTRRAQILYMSKDIESEPLTNFIEADTKTVEELYTLYNRLHSLGTGISDSQLRAIVLRTESYLEYILRVREW